MAHASLFTPLQLGRYTLAHRVVMAPLTRMRATPGGNEPRELNAQYYGQRASEGGLIISEATQVVQSGQAYPTTPGLHSDAQVRGWRGVTEAVHAKGGLIFAQLWHTGRVSHSSYQDDGGAPFAPSAVRADGQSLTPDWSLVELEVPRALTLDEIRDLIAGYRLAAANALASGFDGVELHGANGYLLAQFLNGRINQRTDLYGGSAENRARLLLEIVNVVVEVFGADRVGLRLSPFTDVNDGFDPEPEPTYAHVATTLDALGLAYLHVIEPRPGTQADRGVSTADFFRPLWSGTIITADGFTGDSADEFVSAGRADAVAFGRSFIANPDLPERLRRGEELNAYDRTTFNGGTEIGYTDYPALVS